jgi:hypothetical protein
VSSADEWANAAEGMNAAAPVSAHASHTPRLQATQRLEECPVDGTQEATHSTAQEAGSMVLFSASQELRTSSKPHSHVDSAAEVSLSLPQRDTHTLFRVGEKEGVCLKQSNMMDVEKGCLVWWRWREERGDVDAEGCSEVRHKCNEGRSDVVRLEIWVVEDLFWEESRRKYEEVHRGRAWTRLV